MYLQIKRIALTICVSLICFVVNAQQKVTGTVKDANGEPMIGVTILSDGQAAAVTDFNGNFIIPNAKPNTKLTVRYVGYRDQTINIDNRSNVNITMKEDNQQLDEVVVVGYGTMKKKDLTGSVASIGAKDLSDIAAPNALQVMQAKIPGVDLQQSDGEAGSGVSMTLRGSRSLLASNSPLVLVDGVEYGSTLDIPASDIESIDVLKDAASTAIYGTKGANGVIIVTTKHGKSGKTSVNFNMYISSNSATGITKPMYGNREVQRLIDAQDYKNMQTAGDWSSVHRTTKVSDVLQGEQLSDGTSCLDIYNNKSYTDWLDIIMKNSISQNYEISVQGGNGKTNFSVSLADMIDNGLMSGDKYNRYTGRANIDHKINKIVKIGANFSYVYKSNDKRNSGVYNQAQKTTTITHPYLTDGTINAQPDPWYAAHCSPLLDRNGNYQRNIETSRFFGSAYIELTPLRHFNFKSQFTLDRSTDRDGLYEDYQSQPRYQNPSTTYISNAKVTTTRYVWQNTANYNLDFNNNNFIFMLGHEMTQSVDETSSISGDAGAEHYYKSSFYDLSKIASPTAKSSYIKSNMLSFFGRVNYAYNSRYLLQGSLRADGSSVLARGHKWGYFPSVSAGWRISDEGFMSSTRSWLDNLKFRVSWGLSGNSAIKEYQTLATISSIVPNSTDKAPMTMANNDLTWEKTSALDFGLDFSFINSRLYGSFDYYTSHTYDLLYYKTAPPSSIYTSQISNVGKTKGHGFELSLGAVPVQTKKFKWDMSVSVTFARDYVDELTNGVTQYVDGINILRVNNPVSAYYSYKVQNCWGVGEFDKYVADNYTSKGVEFTKPYSDYGTPGTPKIIDQNHDGIIDDKDKVIYNRSPKAILGFTTSFRYRDFSLSVQTMARIGGYMYYEAYGLYTYDGSNWGDLDYWTPDHTNTVIPSPGATGTSPTAFKSAIEMQKADYFKIKDITLTYQLPKNLLHKYLISDVRVYCSLKNFITFSHFGDYDSERDGAITFPLRKQIVVGLNLIF